MRTYPYIIGPKEGHAHQGVKTEADYLRVQAEYLASLRQAHVGDAYPRAAGSPSLPYITLGQWVMDCACRNAPSVSVEWDLACCFECGAIYRGLSFPADREAIERVLIARARRARNWEPSETLADVIAQNIEHGDEVPTL